MNNSEVLFYEEEINLDKEKLEDKFTEKELNLALKLVDSMSDKFEPEKYKDEYQDKMAVGICNGVIEYLNAQ